MGRSLKKGPFVDLKLLKRIEFAPTRTFKGHAGDKATKGK